MEKNLVPQLFAAHPLEAPSPLLTPSAPPHLRAACTEKTGGGQDAAGLTLPSFALLPSKPGARQCVTLCLEKKVLK